jgi:hypothetical protein
MGGVPAEAQFICADTAASGPAAPAQKPSPQKPASQQKPAAEQKPATEQKLPVSLEQALYLIRSTLLTLNDANRSGNYTVLRELAGPNFQAKNTAADLGTIFADLRNRKVDLFAVAVMAPQLSAPPQLEANGMLRLTGAFPTRPLQISFDLLFENADGQWRLFGISVQTQQPQQQPAALR